MNDKVDIVNVDYQKSPRHSYFNPDGLSKIQLSPITGRKTLENEQVIPSPILHSDPFHGNLGDKSENDKINTKFFPLKKSYCGRDSSNSVNQYLKPSSNSPIVDYYTGGSNRQKGYNLSPEENYRKSLDNYSNSQFNNQHPQHNQQQEQGNESPFYQMPYEFQNQFNMSPSRLFNTSGRKSPSHNSFVSNTNQQPFFSKNLQEKIGLNNNMPFTDQNFCSFIKKSVSNTSLKQMGNMDNSDGRIDEEQELYMISFDSDNMKETSKNYDDQDDDFNLLITQDNTQIPFSGEGINNDKTSNDPSIQNFPTCFPQSFGNNMNMAFPPYFPNQNNALPQELIQPPRMMKMAPQMSLKQGLIEKLHTQKANESKPIMFQQQFQPNSQSQFQQPQTQTQFQQPQSQSQTQFSQSQFQPQLQTQYQPQTHSQYQPQTHSQYQPQTHSQYQPQTHSQYQPQTHPQYQPQTHPQYQPQTHSQYQPQTHSQYQPQTHPQYQPQLQYDQQVKSQTPTQHTSQNKFQQQPQFQSQSQFQQQPQYEQFQPRQQIPLQSQLQTQKPPQFQPQSQPQPQPQSQTPYQFQTTPQSQIQKQPTNAEPTIPATSQQTLKSKTQITQPQSNQPNNQINQQSQQNQISPTNQPIQTNTINQTNQPNQQTQQSKPTQQTQQSPTEGKAKKKKKKNKKKKKGSTTAVNNDSNASPSPNDTSKDNQQQENGNNLISLTTNNFYSNYVNNYFVNPNKQGEISANNEDDSNTPNSNLQISSPTNNASTTPQQIASTSDGKTTNQSATSSKKKSKKKIKKLDPSTYVNLSIEELAKNIYSLAKDQAGCRYLQNKIEEKPNKAIAEFFPAIIPHIHDLSNDAFGNYLIQKMFEYLTPEDIYKILSIISPDILDIGANSHGTRVIQSLIDYLETDNLIEYFITIIKPYTVQLIKELNGTHIIQKFSDDFPDYSDFIYDDILDNAQSIATHRHGCCVLQRYLIDKEDKFCKKLTSTLLKDCLVLAVDQFGNYIIQAIMKLNDIDINNSIAHKMIENVIYYSKHKYSSNIVEKCFDCCDIQIKQQLLQLLSNQESIQELLIDEHGNYVVQKVLACSDSVTQNELLMHIVPLLEKLKSAAFGDKIISRLLFAYPKLNTLVDPSITQYNIESTFNNINNNNPENIQDQKIGKKHSGPLPSKHQPNSIQAQTSTTNPSINNHNQKYGYTPNKQKFK